MHSPVSLKPGGTLYESRKIRYVDVSSDPEGNFENERDMN